MLCKNCFHEIAVAEGFEFESHGCVVLGHFVSVIGDGGVICEKCFCGCQMPEKNEGVTK